MFYCLYLIFIICILFCHNFPTFLFSVCSVILLIYCYKISFFITDTKTPRITLNIVGLLITVLQDLPEHADVVEKILFDDDSFNFMCLLEQPSDALRMRLCILISLLCTFSCTAFSVAMDSKWRKNESDCLEALHTHCNVTLNRAARLATKELSNMPFYVT